MIIPELRNCVNSTDFTICRIMSRNQIQNLFLHRRKRSCYTMKRFLLIFAALFFIGGSHAQEYRLTFKNTTELQAFLHWSASRIPLVSCHRGGPIPGFPENAIETFANSIRNQPSVIECDAGFSKDSVLMMMHDDRLDRTTNGTGELSDKTFAELRKLKLKDNEGKLTSFQIPTLDEVLEWGKNKVLFTLDIKRGVPYKSLIEAVRRNKAESYSIIITYTANQAAEVHKLAPDLMISASVRSISDLERLNSLGVPNDRIVAFVGVSAPEKSVYDYLHGKGIWCILGTMGNLDNSAKANGEALYERLTEEGADILSSDRSVECGKQLLNYSKKHKLSSPHLVITEK